MALGEVKKIERLISIFQYLLRTKFDKTRYDHRLMLQKIAYIVKIKDKGLHYHFNWYVRGPYSPDLTREEYEFRESETSSTSEADKKNADFLKNLVGEINDNNLELFASVYYLMEVRKIRDFEDIYFTIHASKPWFDKEEVKQVFNKIIDSKIINSTGQNSFQG